MKPFPYCSLIVFLLSCGVALSSANSEKQISVDLVIDFSHNPQVTEEKLIRIRALVDEVLSWFVDSSLTPVSPNFFNWTYQPNHPPPIEEIKIIVTDTHNPTHQYVAEDEKSPCVFVLHEIPEGNSTRKTYTLYLFVDRLFGGPGDMPLSMVKARFAYALGREVFGTVQFILEEAPSDEAIFDDTNFRRYWQRGELHSMKLVAQIAATTRDTALRKAARYVVANDCGHLIGARGFTGFDD